MDAKHVHALHHLAETLQQERAVSEVARSRTLTHCADADGWVKSALTASTSPPKLAWSSAFTDLRSRMGMKPAFLDRMREYY